MERVYAEKRKRSAFVGTVRRGLKCRYYFFLVFFSKLCYNIAILRMIGEEKMKKIIALLVATLMCSIVFVGCGDTGEQTAMVLSNGDIILGEFLPHSDTLKWTTREDDYKFKRKYKNAIGMLIFDDVQYSFNDSGQIDQVLYQKQQSRYYDVAFSSLSKMYGSGKMTEYRGNTWSAKLSSGETCTITLKTDEDNDTVVLTYMVERKTEENVSVSSATSSATATPATSSGVDSTTIGSKSFFFVDWNRCISETKENSRLVGYSYVKDVYINVDDDKREIVFMAILSDATKPEVALDYADTMIRQFNMWARMQDETIRSSSKDYYGGLYDYYSIRIGVAPLSQSDNRSKWFVSDYINRGLHTKHEIKLEKAYRGK